MHVTNHAHDVHPRVREVLDQYNAAVNYREWDRFDEVFTENAVWEIADPINLAFTGITEIREGLATSVMRQTELTQASSALVIDGITATSARARSTMIEVGQESAARTAWVAAVTFDDELVLTDSGWRISHRRGSLRHTLTSAT